LEVANLGRAGLETGHLIQEVNLAVGKPSQSSQRIEPQFDRDSIKIFHYRFKKSQWIEKAHCIEKSIAILIILIASH
jgi:hypothetical protein